MSGVNIASGITIWWPRSHRAFQPWLLSFSDVRAYLGLQVIEAVAAGSKGYRQMDGLVLTEEGPAGGISCTG